MTFANPIALAALAGILIPLAIHLLSRKEGKVIRIGSLRHLEETSTRQFKSIKLNEILLLVLRSLLIVWLAGWLSGAQFSGSDTHTQKWLLVEPGLEHEPMLSRLTDSLTAKGFEIRTWTEGFPPLRDSVRTPPQDYWALVEALADKPLSEAVIFSTNRAQAFNGRRVALPEHVRWISASLPDNTFVLARIRTNSDSAWIRTGISTAYGTSFETRKLPAREITDTLTTADTIHIALSIDNKYAYDGRIIQAALRTLQQTMPERIDVELPEGPSLTGTPDWVIWLRDEPLPTTTTQSLVLDTRTPGRLLQQKEPGKWIINRRLLPDVAVRENLTLSLANLLTPHHTLWTQAATHDRRAADDRQVIHQDTTTAQAAVSTEADPTLWILLTIITLLAERFVAYRRNQ
jgi:hypothetical protein